MGWLQRMFGHEDKPAEGPALEAAAAPEAVAAAASVEAIAPERVGLNGEYDQSGLAKRVAHAFDQDQAVANIETVWVAQTGSTVVLKGEVPTQDELNRLVEIANNVNGTSAVDAAQVTVG
jgi:osmotically-inducible protein OsmY